MKLFIVLAVSMVILASMADVSDAIPKRCKWIRCTADIQIPFCAENSRGFQMFFKQNCDMHFHNCVHNEDFEKKHNGRC